METANKRRGVTLIEALMGVLIVLVILFAAWHIFISGMFRSSETARDAALMVGVRDLMENLTRDVNAAHAVLSLQGADATDGEAKLRIFRYSHKPDIAERLRENAGGSSGNTGTYPFHVRNTSVEVKMTGKMVTYSLNAAQKKVIRREEDGVFYQRFRTPTEVDGASAPTFRGGGSPKVTETATEVQKFELMFLGYVAADQDNAGQVKVLQPSEIGSAAAIGVHLLAGDDPAQPRTTRGRPSTVDIATKVWVMRKVYDAAYPEYFSSTDEDLRF